MLKGVKKGIKKKIKGKKDKKEDDLFDPEQLEKYKRELEEAKKARQQDDESGAGSSGGAAGHEEDEEWLKFKQLTSGVDVLVNKASTDLEKIKESSFFQRNKPSEQNKLFASERPADAIVPSPEREGAAGKDEHTDEEAAVEGDENKEPAEDEGIGEDTVDGFMPKVPDSPDIPVVDIDDSLFDTTFVDAIATGDIKLAYIPDSPTEEEGDDPFDTSGVADVVKRIEEEEKKAKRQVNLGDAVEVLTGKADKTGIARPRIKAAEMKAKARPRPHAINLLGDFEEGAAPSAPPTMKPGEVVEKPKDLFDQLLDTPSKDTASPLLEKVDLLAAISKKDDGGGKKESEGEKTPKKEIKDVISEFDIISQLDPIAGGGLDPEPLPSAVPSSIPSSIAALLTTTTTSNDDNKEPEEVDELDDEFAALAAESLQKHGPLPEEKKEEEEDDDPFNTSFVETLAAHGKCELKILENEFLGEVKSSESAAKASSGLDDDDDFDFDPRAGEEPPKTLQIQNAPKANPLEDLSPVAVKAPAIQPQVKAAGPTLVDTKGGEGGVGHEEDIDPFDTDHLETVLPGKAELKLLEAELLSSVDQPKVGPPKLPEAIVSAIVKKQQTEDDDFDFDPRKDEVKHHVLDLHDPSHHAFDEVSTVLQPQQEQEAEIDPFDTSQIEASGLIPGALELKLLEDELVTPTKESNPVPAMPVTSANQQKMTRTFSDEDFDPRGGVPPPPPKPLPTTEDIFDSTMDFAVDKPLTPQQEVAPIGAPEPKLCPTNVDDPFDTSGIQIENYLAKSELKQVEEELLSAPAQQPTPPRTLPVIVGVELKKPPPQTTAPPPPEPPKPQVPHLLEAMTPTEDTIKPLTPVEVPTSMSGVISVFNPSPMADPFDTSHAEGVIPGKTEIKLLEEELGVGAGAPRRLSDPDFDPREPSHPSNQLVSKPLTPVSIQQPMPITPKKADEASAAAAAAAVTDSAEIDPFDTSLADTMMPGKAELKALEAELL